jgi:hypothetical protein
VAIDPEAAEYGHDDRPTIPDRIGNSEAQP